MGTDLVVGSDRDVEDVLGHQIPGGAFGQDGHDVATPVQPLALVDGPHLGVARRNLPPARAAGRAAPGGASPAEICRRLAPPSGRSSSSQASPIPSQSTPFRGDQLFRQTTC